MMSTDTDRDAVMQRLLDQTHETAERLRHVANDALAAAERLKAENARLRDALARTLQEIEQVCASRSVGKMDAEAQACLATARKIAIEALEAK